jgi:Tfp pilus assembly protein PilV
MSCLTNFLKGFAIYDLILVLVSLAVISVGLLGISLY